MMDFLTWGALLTSAGSLIAVAKFWMDMGAAQEKAAQALAKVEAVTADLSNYKLQAARDFATDASLAESERRLANAIDGLRGDFRAMAERIDRVLSLIAERTGGGHVRNLAG